MDQRSSANRCCPRASPLLTETMPDRRIGVGRRLGAERRARRAAERLGISHFIEHMMFKGTERRDARAIAAEPRVARRPPRRVHRPRAGLLLRARAVRAPARRSSTCSSDIVCRSRFAPREVEREKSVVREEIFACEDNPEDKISELLAGAGVGRPRARPADPRHRRDRRRARRPTLRGYFRSRYRAEHLVVVGGGRARARAPGRAGRARTSRRRPASRCRSRTPPPAFRAVGAARGARGPAAALPLARHARAVATRDAERYRAGRAQHAARRRHELAAVPERARGGRARLLDLLRRPTSIRDAGHALDPPRRLARARPRGARARARRARAAARRWARRGRGRGRARRSSRAAC